MAVGGELLAAGGPKAGASGYRWHPVTDGAGCFAVDDGGWILTANSESDRPLAGASAIRFDNQGSVVDAYRILGGDDDSGSHRNCAGGETPWGTWLSCEEHTGGFVWECDPFGEQRAIRLPALGRFAHEAAVVDPASGQIYLTEDANDSRLYRYTPRTPPATWGARPNIDDGILEVMAVGVSGVEPVGRVRWVEVDAADPRTYRPPGTRVILRGEGMWYHSRAVYFVATTLSEVYRLDLDDGELELVFANTPRVETTGPLTEVDNITVHGPSGDLYCCEDAGDLELVLITAPSESRRVMAPFLRVGGHVGSELVGAVFDPTGTRLYVGSQSGSRSTRLGPGIIYEVSGPFRGTQNHFR